MVLSTILKKNAESFPSEISLTMKMGFRVTSLTYGEIYDIARNIALLMEREGVFKGDKVLLLAPNSPYWGCVFWACILSGVVAVPLTIQSSPEMVERVAEQTGAKLFFAHRFYKGDSPRGIKRHDLEFLKYELEKFDPKAYILPHVSEDDLVEILYTSGTTGDPKGVQLTHKNLYANIEAVSQVFDVVPGKDRILSILPLSHIFEQAMGLLLPAYYRSHVIYAHSPAAIMDLLKEYKVTKMLVVPEFLKLMMERIEVHADTWWKKKLIKRFLGGRLDTIACGGAPLDIELEQKWNAIGIRLFQGYGLTETSPLVTTNGHKAHKLGSVGKVVPGVEVVLAEDGEILVKGPNVFSGYFEDEQRTREAFTSDGYFKTGDVGRFDEDGFLFLKGRKKYIILGPGGQNVFPEDIEALLHTFDEVKDCTVVGVEREGGMVEIHAVFLLEDLAADLAGIVERANAKLASYQRITGYSVWPEDDFERSATKKIKKEPVIAYVQQKTDRESSQGKPLQGWPLQGKPLIRLVSSVAGVDSSRIGMESVLARDLQMDSLMRIELIARIEHDFNVLIDEAEIVDTTTVADVQEMIHNKKPIKPLAPLRRWPRTFVVGIIRAFLQGVVFLITRIWMKIKVEGVEHIADIPYPAVFMSNHLAYYDPVLLAAALPRKVRKKVSFAAAQDVLYEEYWWFVPFAEVLYHVFPFPRKSGENIRLGLDYMGRMIDAGYSVAVFPEGKISEDGKLLPLKRGAGLIAVEMEVPIVPVIIEGSEKIFPYDKFLPRRRGVIKIKFGKPLYFNLKDSYVRATEQIEQALREL